MTEHRYPRRAAQKTKSYPFMGIAYWEQLTPDGEITVHYDGSYPPARSCWDNFDSLLNGNAHYGLVEIFDHHFPRYFEVLTSRGQYLRRKFLSATDCRWADGVSSEINLCLRVHGAGCNGGYYDSLQSLEASKLFIETDANGKTVALPLAQSLQQVDELKDQRADAFIDAQRRIINRCDTEIIELRQEVKKLKDDAHFALASSLSSGLTITKLRAELIEMTKKYDNMLWSAKSYSNKCDSYEKAAQALRVERDDRKRKYDEATDDVTKIFYAVGPNPPIVQNFIAKGELYGSAMTRLAHEFVMLRNERDTLRNNAERSQCAGHYATIQYDRLRYAINDIVKFSRRNPSETDLDIITRVFNERDALNKTIQKVKDELK